MKTPAITLPINVMSAVDSHGQPSPLGRFLASALADARGYSETPIKREAAQGLMEAALSLACQFPFSPDETIEVGRRQDKFSLVQAVLHMAQSNHPHAAARKWPATIEQFGQRIAGDEGGQATTVDCEWVAAALVRAGCNPWNMHDGVPVEVDQAISLGMTGLVEVLFSIDGAPHPDRVLVEKDISRVRQIGLLARDPSRAGMLDMLTRGGIGHWHIDEDMVTEFVFGRPEGMAVLLKNGLDLSDPKIKAQISRGWLDRVKSNTLEPEACASMQKMAFGNTAQDMDASSLMVTQILAVDWGSTANGSSARAYDFMGSTGVEALCGKGKVRRGQMAGQWSVLAAGVMSRMRQANPNGWHIPSGRPGCLGWSAKNMVERKYDDQAQQWKYADIHDPALKGSLANAIGFEWSKGISIDGIVALGLWGQEDNGEADQMQRIEDFPVLAGIEDLQDWSRKSAAHAAAFTCAIIKPNTVSVASAMMSTWVRALELCPGMVEGIDEEARVDLMRSLTCMFHLPESWSTTAGRGVFQKLVDGLFDDLQWSELVSQGLPAGPRREAALVLALVETMNSGAPSERRQAIISSVRSQLALPEEQGGASGREKDILASWAKGHRKDSAMKAEVDMVTMEIHTAQAQPVSGRRGPRL